MNNMELKAPNDILVATLTNPNATTYDLVSSGLTPENTSLYERDKYKESKFIQDHFKTKEGKFDDLAFENAYKQSKLRFTEMSDDNYLDNLNEVEYSPFNITRPKDAKTFSVNLEFKKDFNPFKQVYGRTAIDSIDDNDFSLRELAQQSKVYDPESETWSEKSANDLNLLDKFFGDTLVYAQYDTDGVHMNPETGKLVNHVKGDWKVNEDGNLYLEKLAGREIYGKQVVNPMDMLTTDGSIANKFDFMDSDSREKSLTGTAFKLAAEIAPVLIPGVGLYYGGVKAAIGLASVMPTFYKSFESLLLGEQKSALTGVATNVEGWMSKFGATSVSDEASSSMFNAEQMAGMVGDIFTQIYEQRAAASLSKLIMRSDKLMDDTTKRLALKVNQEILDEALKGKIDFKDIEKLSRAAMEKIPSLKSVIDKQSQMSKAFSLSYMALTSTGDIYGEALGAGYDRRTAGFAALAATAGQYGIMMNNRMGDWFLDKTTGYTAETNKALLRQSIKPHLDEVAKIFSEYSKNPTLSKAKLAGVFGKVKNGLSDTFGNASIVGESMWKNAIIEGVEEVTEQVVLDATKGMIDTMSYLGLTKKKGSFDIVGQLTSREGLENYLANFVGGVLGGGLFEFERSVYSPWVNGQQISPLTRKTLYESIAAGHKDQLIDIVKKESKKYGNQYLSMIQEDGSYSPSSDQHMSQAEMISKKAVEVIETIDGILNSHDLGHSDEEIVRKAIRDEITIENLRKTIPENGFIGLEGIILEDYKTNMVKITNLSAELKQLDLDPNKAEEAKIKKAQLKTSVDAVNEILTGEKSLKYFDQISFYLNKKINQNFVTLDRNTYTKKKYKVEYSTLPETGAGLTQESINKEWLDSVDKRDILKELQVYTEAYKALELELNKPIADYVETGYDIVRKETFDKILDIKETIKLFNTATDEKSKANALDRFIQINNEFEGLKLNKVTPWDVYNTDMYNQLDSLGLIKKLSYITNPDGSISETIEDFTPNELATVLPELNKTRAEDNKEYIEGFFKKFPLNPLNAEGIINNFNQAADNINKSVLTQIAQINAKPDKTPEDLETIEKLKKSMVLVRVDSMMNTPEIKALRQERDDKILKYKTDNAIDDKALSEYTEAVMNSAAYSLSFNGIINEIANEGNEGQPIVINSWEELNKEQIKKLLTRLDTTGILLAIQENLRGAENTEEAIANAIIKLSSEITEDQYLAEVKPILDNIFYFAEEIINTRYTIKNSPEIKATNDYLNKINKEFIEEAEKLKPDILKINNYALDLLIKELESGNADRELFLEAEKMFQEELKIMKDVIFSEFKNLSTEDNQTLLSDIDANMQELNAFTAEISSIIDDENERGDEFDINGDLIKKTGETTAKEILEDNTLYTFKNEALRKVILNSIDVDLNINSLLNIIFDLNNKVKSNKNKLERVNKFIQLKNKGLTLKNNTLYDFIRNFALSLNSNPKGKVAKIIDILEREDTALKAASNITNYTADDIREQDINQVISILEMMKSVVYAMSTTTVSYEDPVGFISARQNFATKNKIKDDVLKLKTITSDVAELMANDLDRIITKLDFVRQLSLMNAGKMMNEQELIRSQMTKIFIDSWANIIKKINPSFLPINKILEAINSKDSDEKKLMVIENLVFDFTKSKKQETFNEILKNLENVDSSNFSKIDREVTASAVTNWELALYYATVMSTRAEDTYIRSLNTINGEFNKAPFYTQELASRMVKASTVDPELFASIYSVKKNSLNDDADFITMIFGSAGTGKTTTVLGLTIDNFRQTNSNTNIWLSAPSTEQSTSLEAAILDSVGKEKLSTESFDKNTLFEKLGIKKLISDIEAEIKDIKSNKNTIITLEDSVLKINLPENWEESVNFNNLPNLLIIDEVTHYSFAELHLLNQISKLSYKKDSTNFMKVIGAGDPTQLGYLAEIDGKFYEYNVNAVNSINVPRLWSTIRASNVQKRTNNDTFTGLVQKVVSVYRKHSRDPITAENEAKEFLKNVNTITGLSNYSSDNELYGDIITDKPDKRILTSIKNAIAEDPNKKIGILSDNGEIDAELNKVLSELGLIKPDGSHPNIVVFTTNNIQGREIDYFIFDAKFVSKFDKTKDQIRAFNTYMSRSKDASIIIDSNNFLKEQLDITNATPSTYKFKYDPLTKEVIAKSKEIRKKALIELLGENPTIVDDNFKWKTGSTEEVQEETSIEVPTTPLFVDASNEKKEALEEEKRNIETALKGLNLPASEYKYMLHSFYNNPNAKVSDSSIEVNSTGTKTDLNLLRNINNKQEVQNIIKDWAGLKNFLLHNIDSVKKGKISSRGFQNYLKNIFTENSDFKNSQDIETELILTLQSFDPIVNTPYAKQGKKVEAMLNNQEPFINLSVKLKFGNAYHYITLATLAKQSTIEDYITKNVPDGADKNRLLDKIKNKYSELKNLVNTNANQLFELATVESNNLEIITSTRLEKVVDAVGNPVTYKLTDLETAFPGMKYSEIRMFPGKLDNFRNLVHKYTFGEDRSEDKINYLFNLLKNKPYIVVSYDTDLEGSSSSKRVKAKLIPISAEKRSFDVLLEEITETRREIAGEIKEAYEKELLSGSTESQIREGKKIKVSDTFNAKAETLLNRSQILDILITWATTKSGNETLLDLLTKETKFDISYDLFQKSHNILDVLNNFRGGNNATLEKLNNIITLVKNAVKDNEKVSSADLIAAVKKQVIEKSAGITGWHWNFYNLFAFENIVNRKKEKDFWSLISFGILNESVLFTDNGYKEMIANINELMNPIKGMQFYYSLPIKPGLTVNEFINGSNGFSPEFFGDRFKINVAPESERLLLKIEDFETLLVKPVAQTPPPSREEQYKEAFDAIQATLASLTFEVVSDLNADQAKILEEFDKSIGTTISEFIDVLSSEGIKMKVDLQNMRSVLISSLNKYYDKVQNATPVASFIKDTTITLTDGTNVSVFENLNNILWLLENNPGEVLITSEMLIAKIKEFQTRSFYQQDKNKLVLIEAFFGDNGLDVSLDNDNNLLPVNVLKTFAGTSTNGNFKKGLLTQIKIMLDKLNECKPF